MKTFKILAASLLAFAFVNAVSAATTTIYITGSSAFRAETHNAIRNILTAGYTFGYEGATIGGANRAIFKGITVTTGKDVIIKTAWAGSAGGIQSNATNPHTLIAGAPFIIDTPSVALSTTGTANIPAGDITENHTPDVNLSDAFQGSTPFQGGGFSTLVDQIVGVVPFVWIKGGAAGAPAGLTNVSQMQINNLLSGGLLLSEMTGNPADAGVVVYCVGRDADSGTRLSAFACSGFGINSVSQQYTVNGAVTSPVSAQSGGSGNITGVSLWPASTILGKNYGVGDGGFFSGGKVKDVLNRPITASDVAIVSYIGLGDGASVTGSTGTFHNRVAWNGVALEDAAPYTTVIEGKYDFWCYEHLMYRSDLITVKPDAKVVADQLAVQITNVDAEFAGFGIKLSAMNVHRDSDGSAVLPGPL